LGLITVCGCNFFWFYCGYANKVRINKQLVCNCYNDCYFIFGAKGRYAEVEQRPCVVVNYRLEKKTASYFAAATGVSEGKVGLGPSKSTRGYHGSSKTNDLNKEPFLKPS